MGLFNANDIQSQEFSALLLVQDILSASTALQDLLEAANSTEAESLIVVGPSEPPWNGESYTFDELSGRRAWAQIYPDRGESFRVRRSNTNDGRVEGGGKFRLHIRRQVRPEEYAAASGRNDVWKYFSDQTSAMCDQFAAALDETVTSATLRGTEIARMEIPLFNNQTEHATQGIFIFSDYGILWGSIGQQ